MCLYIIIGGQKWISACSLHWFSITKIFRNKYMLWFGATVTAVLPSTVTPLYVRWSDLVIMRRGHVWCKKGGPLTCLLLRHRDPSCPELLYASRLIIVLSSASSSSVIQISDTVTVFSFPTLFPLFYCLVTVTLIPGGIRFSSGCYYISTVPCSHFCLCAHTLLFIADFCCLSLIYPRSCVLCAIRTVMQVQSLLEMWLVLL